MLRSYWGRGLRRKRERRGASHEEPLTLGRGGHQHTLPLTSRWEQRGNLELDGHWAPAVNLTQHSTPHLTLNGLLNLIQLLARCILNNPKLLTLEISFGVEIEIENENISDCMFLVTPGVWQDNSYILYIIFWNGINLTRNLSSLRKSIMVIL